MKLSVAFSYIVVFCFLCWCAFTFRADSAQIQFAPVWAAKYSIFFALLLSLLNYALRVFRWTLYLFKLGHPLPLKFSALTYIAGFAFTLSPGKIGELVRGRYYQKMGIPLSSTAAAFFVERLLDLLSMLALAFVALASLSAYDTLIWGAAFVMLLLLFILAVSPWMNILEYAERVHWIPEYMKKAIKSILRTLLSAKELLTPRLLVIGFIIGVVAWGAEGTGLMFIGAMTPNIAIDWITAIGIYSIAIIVGALSFLPGGLGSTEAVMIALLVTHGFSMPSAILLTITCRLLTLWLAIVIGWIAVGVLRHATI